jgi:hypothetical protein
LFSSINRSVIATNKRDQFCLSGTTALPFIKQFTGRVCAHSSGCVKFTINAVSSCFSERVIPVVSCEIDVVAFLTGVNSFDKALALEYGLSFRNFKYSCPAIRKILYVLLLVIRNTYLLGFCCILVGIWNIVKDSICQPNISSFEVHILKYCQGSLSIKQGDTFWSVPLKANPEKYLSMK